jgi:hypothetical protein
MKVRVTQVESGSGDGGASFVRERAQPTLRSADGCEGLIAVTADGGRGYSITLWRDEQAMEATEDLAAGLRAEAEQQGLSPSIFGRFDAQALEMRGGEPHAARFVRFSGSGDLKGMMRDKVVPALSSREGFCGLMAASTQDGGIGVSLWSSRQAIEDAREITERLPGWLSESGMTLDSVEVCDVAVCDVMQGAHA